MPKDINKKIEKTKNKIENLETRLEELEALLVKPYPKLMISQSGNVILAIGEGSHWVNITLEGYLVTPGNDFTELKAGQFSTEWVKPYFKDFTGTLEVAE